MTKVSTGSPLEYHSIAPAPALLWQFTMQNRGLLTGLSALFFVSLFLPLTLGTLGMFLAISYLGASVFQGDTLGRQTLFLAERGVSPVIVWLTRQAVPMVILLLAMGLVYGVGLPYQPALQPLFDSTTFALLAACMLCVFTVAQWLGQVSSSAIVSAIAAPLVTLVALTYLSYCAVELEARWWSIVLALLLPLVATWWGARDWLDRRSDRWTWCWHGSALLLFVLLPLASLVSFEFEHPRMSRAVRNELQMIARQYPSATDTPRELSFTPFSGKTAHHAELALATQESIRRSLAFDSAAVSSHDAHVACMVSALKLRLSEAAITEPVKKSAVTNEYRQWLELLVAVHDRLRLSWRLIEQDQADVIEIWLVEELKAPEARQRLGDDLLTRLKLVFQNGDERQLARRRAIALSWQNASEQLLGGYHLNDADGPGYVTTIAVWEARRRADETCELLLKSLDANGNELEQLRRRISQLLGYGANVHPFYVANARGERQLLYYETGWNAWPGTFWNSDWEREGLELAAAD